MEWIIWQNTVVKIRRYDHKRILQSLQFVQHMEAFAAWKPSLLCNRHVVYVSPCTFIHCDVDAQSVSLLNSQKQWKKYNVRTNEIMLLQDLKVNRESS